MTEIVTKYFRIITTINLLLGILTYPWWKKPWNQYAGRHTFGWLYIWLCCLSFLHWYTKSNERHFIDYYFFLAIIVGVIGVILLIVNYRS